MKIGDIIEGVSGSLYLIVGEMECHVHLRSLEVCKKCDGKRFMIMVIQDEFHHGNDTLFWVQAMCKRSESFKLKNDFEEGNCTRKDQKQDLS